MNSGFMKRVIGVLSLGIVFFIYSEEIFWSFLRLEDVFFGKLQTWLLYSAATYIVLWLSYKYKANSLGSFFIIGATYGWIIEGLVVLTMYEELPLSISFTGLAWHSLITLFIGFVLFQDALVKSNKKKILKLSCFVGAFWGWWGVSWQFELGYLASVDQFFIYASILTILMFIGFLIYNKMNIQEFNPSKLEKIMIYAFIVVYFVIDLLYLGILIIILWIPLMSLNIFALKRHADKIEDESKAIDEEKKHYKITSETNLSKKNIVIMLIIPVVATMVYFGLIAMDLVLPYNILLYLITTPLGFILYIYSLIKTLKR
ncbi:MAG: hypothetical protein GF364_03560 [Candidatus Lokiarchaeota archaeon]|nr:hypothetical protein [Candidatus Lokiarchaeota archaeon]